MKRGGQNGMRLKKSATCGKEKNGKNAYTKDCPLAHR